METLKSGQVNRTVFALAALMLTLTLVIPAQAAPTVRPFAGKTSVLPSEDFAAALDSLGIALGIIHPASPRKGYVRFPITGGGIDLADFRGDIFHVGGLSLTDEGGTTVELFNFIIDTTATPVLTGLVTADGNVVDRIPLFNLGLTTNPEVESGKIIIRNVNLTLTAEAAAALNAVFGVTAFEEGFNVGEAKVNAVYFDDDDDDDDDNDDDDGDDNDDDDGDDD